MSATSAPTRILVVTGMSGAGKTTALRTLEDMGWEVVDNFPLRLLDRLLDTPQSEGSPDGVRPLAIGIDSRTRGFDADAIVRRAERISAQHSLSTLFVDCADAELERRYSETRRRHPLALDRPAVDGIQRERELLSPLRATAEHLVDTTDLTARGLEIEVRDRFADSRAGTTVVVTSFGYARGLPRNADLVFDMRFLRNPHWDPTLRPLTGHDPAVGAYVAADAVYDAAMERIEALLLLLVPRYHAEGKPYVVIAVGCTGGRHRSVHVAERIGARLHAAGFSPTILHRDLPGAAIASGDPGRRSGATATARPRGNE